MRSYDFERLGRFRHREQLQPAERIFRSHVDKYHEIRPPAPLPEPYPTMAYPPARYEETHGHYLPYQPGPATPPPLEDGPLGGLEQLLAPDDGVDAAPLDQTEAVPDYERALMSQELFDAQMADVFADPWALEIEASLHHGALEPPDILAPPMPEEQAFDQAQMDNPFPDPGPPMM